MREEGDACDACNRSVVTAARLKLYHGGTKSEPVIVLDEAGEEALADYEEPEAADPVRPTADELRLAAMLLAEEKKQDVEEKAPLAEEGAPGAGGLSGVDADGLEGFRAASPVSSEPCCNGYAGCPGRVRVDEGVRYVPGRPHWKTCAAVSVARASHAAARFCLLASL